MKPDRKPPPTLDERVRQYMEKVEPSISGQNGHDAAFRAACKLVIGFALSEADALRHLREWNQRCSPPWEERDLARKIREAQKASTRPGSSIGCLRGTVLDYARGTTPRPSSGPQAARSHASTPSRPQASGNSPPSSSGPKAPARSLPFLVGAAGPAPSPAAPAASHVPPAPAIAAPSLPASVLAAVRASVALWREQSGDEPTALYVPAGHQWPAQIDGLAVIIDPTLSEITPGKPEEARTATDGQDGCKRSPIHMRTSAHPRG